MSAPNIVRAFTTASNAIAKYGELCQWFKPGPDVDTDTPWAPDADQPPAAVGIRIMWTHSKQHLLQLISYNAANDVPTATKFGLMAGHGLTFAPEFRDGMRTSDGRLYTLVRADPLGPDGNVILWFVQFAIGAS